MSFLSASKIALEVLKGSIEKYNIDFESKLIVDGGSEYKGEVTQFTNDQEYLTKLIAQKDITQSNSMIEAVNKHLKYYYLFKMDLKDYNETVNYLMKSIPGYNNKPCTTPVNFINPVPNIGRLTFYCK